MTRPLASSPAALTATALAAALALAAPLAPAQMIDVAQGPLNAAGTQVKPNIMFILDDSGSMNFEFMPDEVGMTKDWSRDTQRGEFMVGYWSAQCNGVAFDPSLEYAPPVNAAGAAYPNASFTAARPDGFRGSTATTNLPTNLNNSFYYVYVPYTGSPAAMSWTYYSSGAANESTVFYRECMQTMAAAEASGRFRKVTLNTADTSAEAVALRQKYANWYTYYRSRKLTMRSAVGRSFRSIGENYRVGITLLSDASVTSSSFLGVNDFVDRSGVGSGLQRSDFYRLLYSAETVDGWTPLRGALSKVGRYFGKTYPGQNTDPVQHSCQRNYALLSTDGYWNEGKVGEPGYETGNYRPFKFDNSGLVGQQDGTLARPYRDSTGSDGGGDSNSLADVAYHFWSQDLRPDLKNDVPATERDSATHQHLTTFTVGLGVRGTLTYDRNYLTQTSGDYADIVAGRKQWPVPTGTKDSSAYGDATHIDDLWHAAVNGRGQYFSASNPDSLADAISTMISEISKDSGSGAGAGTSTLTPVTGDDWIFLPSFSSSPSWYGDIRAFRFASDPLTGALIAPDTAEGKEIWSARRKLDARAEPRRILFGKPDGTLADFTYANLQAANLQGSFDIACTATKSSLSQCAMLSDAAKAKVNGPNLVSYLRGDTSLYMSQKITENQVFRTRSSLLGDFINSSPVYLAKAPFKYADAGYSAFATAQASRLKMIYAAANDGMLHAFRVGESTTDSTGGEEAWAFVPRGVINGESMWRLADTTYEANHRNLLDATPVIGDVYDSTTKQWRTILVGGMGAGGRYYYALDITSPLQPQLLWEFTDGNLGLTFGNPVITKNAAGRWVVAFTSGLNNVGDGIGRLFVLDAVDGRLLQTVATPAGNATAPNNLGRLNAWVASETDNTALRYYAGDMQGSLWRFDADDRVAPSGTEAVRLGRALDANGTPQPIVGMPLLTEITTNGVATAIISFGTGRLTNIGDLASTGVQSIYAIKDTLQATGIGGSGDTQVALRHRDANLVQQTLVTSTGTRRVDPVNPVDWSLQNGWYVDLSLSSGERVVLDGVPLGSGVLAYASSIPNSDPCSSGGSAWLYQFDIGKGSVLAATSYSSLLVGIGRTVDSKGNISVVATARDQSLSLAASSAGVTTKSNRVRRTAWRELN